MKEEEIDTLRNAKDSGTIWDKIEEGHKGGEKGLVGTSGRGLRTLG